MSAIFSRHQCVKAYVLPWSVFKSIWMYSWHFGWLFCSTNRETVANIVRNNGILTGQTAARWQGKGEIRDWVISMQNKDGNPWTSAKSQMFILLALLSGVPDFFDRNKILSGYDLSHYQVPHCIRIFFYFVWFVFIHHNFQFYFKLCTYCNILDIYLS